MHDPVVASMPGSILASLAFAGIIERPTGRRCLRVTPRFLAHVQSMARPQPATGRQPPWHQVLPDALQAWGADIDPQATDTLCALMDDGMTQCMAA